MLRRTLRAACAKMEGVTPQIAIVGAGPSGCYVAENVSKALPGAVIDVFERLPMPFGLSRYGVAPDHPEVKNVEKKFMQMFEEKKAFLLGNLAIDSDYTIETLLENYTAVVLSTGAATSRSLGIPGEHLGGVVSGKRLVDFYNTVPSPHCEPHMCPIDLSKTSKVLIIGNGNVAIDCARFFGASWKHWAPTDINKYAVTEMQRSHVREISIVGRRGPEHVACTIAELRELIGLSSMNVRSEPFALSDLGEALQQRPRKRLLELLHDVAQRSNPNAATAPSTQSGDKKIDCCFRFSRTPVKFIEHPKKRGQIGAAIFSHSLAGETRYDLVECDAVVYSIGYRSTPIAGVPFDDARGVVPNTAGRVAHPSGRVYCSGWLKRGPRGVMLQTMMDAKETAKSLVDDVVSGKIIAQPEHRGKFGIVERLAVKNSFPTSISLVRDILKLEKRVGAELGKQAEKVNAVGDMLDYAMGGRFGKRAKRRVLGLMEPRGDAYRTLDDFLDPESRIIDLQSPSKHSLLTFSPNKTL